MRTTSITLIILSIIVCQLYGGGKDWKSKEIGMPVEFNAETWNGMEVIWSPEGKQSISYSNRHRIENFIKQMILMGFYTGASWPLAEQGKTVGDLFPTGISYKSLVNEIDEFYKDKKNANVPLFCVLSVIKTKMSGDTKRSKLLLEAYRLSSDELAKEDKKSK